MSTRSEEDKSQRLVMVPCPYQGHITPMLQLGKALHSNGFSVTIAHTVYNAPNPESHTDFSFVALPEGLPEHDLATVDVVANLEIVNGNCREIFREWLKRAIEDGASRDEVIGCVVSDELMFFADDVAVDLGIPSVVLRTTSAAASLARSGLVGLYARGLLSNRDSLPNELVPDLHPLRFTDLPYTLTTSFEKYTAMISKLYGNRKSSAIAWNTATCLERVILDRIQLRFPQIPIFAIGPIHTIAPPISSSLIDEDLSCIEWLDKQPHRSVIYVSNSGSVASLDEGEAVEIAWGLANSGQRFLWVIRPGSVRGSVSKDWIPEAVRHVIGNRGCIVRWAPQKEVLAHAAVGAFWSHCGWNSTLESLAQGVPMLCRPCFSDQRVNARYLCHVWRVGLEVDELERVGIERAVRGVIAGEEGEEMRERAERFKEEFGVSSKKGGGSYEQFNELVRFIASTHKVGKEDD